MMTLPSAPAQSRHGVVYWPLEARNFSFHLSSLRPWPLAHTHQIAERAKPSARPAPISFLTASAPTALRARESARESARERARERARDTPAQATHALAKRHSTPPASAGHSLCDFGRVGVAPEPASAARHQRQRPAREERLHPGREHERRDNTAQRTTQRRTIVSQRLLGSGPGPLGDRGPRGGCGCALSLRRRRKRRAPTPPPAPAGTRAAGRREGAHPPGARPPRRASPRKAASPAPTPRECLARRAPTRTLSPRPPTQEYYPPTRPLLLLRSHDRRETRVMRRNLRNCNLSHNARLPIVPPFGTAATRAPAVASDDEEGLCACACMYVCAVLRCMQNVNTPRPVYASALFCCAKPQSATKLRSSVRRSSARWPANSSASPTMLLNARHVAQRQLAPVVVAQHGALLVRLS